VDGPEAGPFGELAVCAFKRRAFWSCNEELVRAMSTDSRSCRKPLESLALLETLPQSKTCAATDAVAEARTV